MKIKQVEELVGITSKNIGMFLWGNSVDPIPLGLLIVLVAIPVVIIVCIIGVLIGRIREIDGGEEDEAAKY